MDSGRITVVVGLWWWFNHFGSSGGGERGMDISSSGREESGDSAGFVTSFASLNAVAVL